ncbi:MAG: hypothetical protein ABJH68_12875 [Ilumatobacter sp.]|uniref:DUF6916 family protein n=1 Tax=Ilumatobacter sp. TaxID=1967498 RepID=UPI0032987C21
MTHAHALPRQAAAGSAPLVVDRRQLLIGGTAVAGFALAGLVAPLVSAAVSTGTGASAPLTAASFTPHIGTLFRVRAAGVGAVALRLVEATPTQGRSSEPTLLSGSAYTLILEGPVESRLPAAVYHLSHGALDLPPMHVFPVGRSARVQDYQIIVDTRTFESGSHSRKAG